MGRNAKPYCVYTGLPLLETLPLLAVLRHRLDGHRPQVPRDLVSLIVLCVLAFRPLTPIIIDTIDDTLIGIESTFFPFGTTFIEDFDTSRT